LTKVGSCFVFVFTGADYVMSLSQPFVAWDAFYRALSTLLKRDLAQSAADLQYALGMDPKVTTVSPAQLAVFLAWFGPLGGCIDTVRPPARCSRSRV
jgi:hypothetical protein